MPLERVCEEEKPILEADRPGIGHPLHEEVPGVLHWRKTFRVLAPRVRVARGWRIPGKRSMGPLVVVLLSKSAECSLPCREIALGRPGGLGLDGEQSSEIALALP